jgi:thioesterase domain-containing protein
LVFGANQLAAAKRSHDAARDCKIAKAGEITSIVLVGHSFGASAALSMAETLREAGLQVALIVTFDPVTRNSVPPMFIGWKTSISRTGREYSMPSDLKVVA